MENSSLFQKAIKILSVRDHSVYELRTKLLKSEKDPGAVEEILEKCLEMKYLDDRRFARLFSEGLERRGKGPRFVINELKRRGVEDGLISEVVGNDEDEDMRAKEAALKKLKTLGKDSLQVQKEKIVRFLNRRGFSGETCFKVAQSVIKNDL